MKNSERKSNRNLYIFKLFNFYIIKENKLNEFEEVYKIIYWL